MSKINALKNGLNFEDKTDLSTHYKIKNDKIILNNVEFINLSKSKFHKYFKKNDYANGCKIPDECYLNFKTKTIYIIEKKNQNCKGSVCEKIQTPHFKLWYYNKYFKDYKFVYIYCLSNWFKVNCKIEIEYLKELKIPIFYGDDNDYKEKIIKFITTNQLFIK